MVSEKAKLYNKVDSIRQNFKLPIRATIWTIDLLRLYPDFDIKFASFTTPGFCGIAMVGEIVDTIALNVKRTPLEQNFDCSHELMHLCLHRDIGQEFSCFTQTKPNQSSFLEWQANEGAAQWLIPYQDFIPRFSYFLDHSQKLTDYTLQEYFAEYYHTTPKVVQNRISNLSFEIEQYRQGVPINQLCILSRRQQQERGIFPRNYNTLCECDFSLSWDAMIG